MTPKRSGGAALAACLAASLLTPAVQSQGPAPYTVLLREGRQQLSVRTAGGQELFSLDELAKLFNLSVREDALAGGFTISTKTGTIAMTPGQGLASVGGRMISLPAAPVRDGRVWWVPIDLVPRALGPALGIRLELRRPSRLIVAGDLRVPRVTARIEPAPNAARVVLDVFPAAPHAITQEAGRLLVSFEADALDAALPATSAPELVQAIRQADAGVGVVIELGPRFATFRASDSPAERGRDRIVIELLAAAPETTGKPTDTPAPAPGPEPAPADPPPLVQLTPPGSLRTIVIDAGHGGDEPGARGPQGVLEKNVTLAVARRLKAAIEARLGARVILTREGDQTVGLDERAAVANNNKADLFISLHANSSIRPAASGAEVFYLSLDDYGDEARRIAYGSSERLPVLGGGTRDIEVILWDMAQARHIEGSAAFAQMVERSLRARVPMSARAIQQAPFRVLVGANMPAVLVEMGFISNPDQEKQLASEAFQATLVQALLDSIVSFRESRSRQTASALSPAPATSRGAAP